MTTNTLTGSKLYTNDELLTRDEVALELKVHPSTVTRYAKSGELEAIRFSPRNIRFKASAVRAFIDNREAQGCA